MRAIHGTRWRALRAARADEQPIPVVAVRHSPKAVSAALSPASFEHTASRPSVRETAQKAEESACVDADHPARSALSKARSQAAFARDGRVALPEVARRWRQDDSAASWSRTEVAQAMLRQVARTAASTAARSSEMIDSPGEALRSQECSCSLRAAEPPPPWVSSLRVPRSPAPCFRGGRACDSCRCSPHLSSP